MKIKLIKNQIKKSFNKKIEIHDATIFVRAVFHETNKYYHKVFLDECL